MQIYSSTNVQTSANSTIASVSYTTPTQSRQTNQYAQPIRSGILTNAHINEKPSSPMPVPQIPDPDYSLSESDSEDESSMILARNTKMNEQIGLLPVETSGNSSTRYVNCRCLMREIK